MATGLQKEILSPVASCCCLAMYVQTNLGGISSKYSWVSCGRTLRSETIEPMSIMELKLPSISSPIWTKTMNEKPHPCTFHMLALQCCKVALNTVPQYGYLIHIYSKNHQNKPDLGSYCLNLSLAFTQHTVLEELFKSWKYQSQYCKKKKWCHTS